MSAAEDRSLHLSIPDWFPRPLEDAARRMHASAVRSRSAESIAVVQRLVGDPRMKTVWAELQKRRRADGAFFYEAEALIRAYQGRPNENQIRACFLLHVRERRQLLIAKRNSEVNLRKAEVDLRKHEARLKKAWEVDPELGKTITGFANFEEYQASARSASCDANSELADHEPAASTVDREHVENSTKHQLAAMEVVFLEAVTLGQTFGSAQFWEQRRQSYLERAAEARSEADFLKRAGRHHIKNEVDAHDLRQRGEKLQRSLRKIAENYEAYADLLSGGHLDNSASIEFVRRMARTLKDLFGKELASTVATIASVALDRAITRVAVQDWFV